jgi:hypothetical protein
VVVGAIRFEWPKLTDGNDPDTNLAYILDKVRAMITSDELEYKPMPMEDFGNIVAELNERALLHKSGIIFKLCFLTQWEADRSDEDRGGSWLGGVQYVCEETKTDYLQIEKISNKGLFG